MNEADALLLRAARGNPRGADAVWAAARQRHRHHPMLLGAALVLFVALVVAVAAVSLATRTTDDSQPFVTTPPPQITGTATNDQLEATIAITGSGLEPGSTVTARATVKNVTSEVLDVSVEPGDIISLRWPVMPEHLLESAHRLGITGWDASAVFFRDPDEPDRRYTTPEEMRAAMEAPPRSVALEPGESTTFESVVTIDERVRTGPVTLRFTPRLGSPPPGAPTRATAGQPLRTMVIEVPVTVLPRPDGTVTDADAEVLALEDPKVASWLSTEHAGYPGTLNGETSNAFGGGATPDGYLALVVTTRDDSQAEWPLDRARELNRPGFVARVDRQGIVTVEYFVN